MTPDSPPRPFAVRIDWRDWLARLERWPAWRLFLGALLLGLLVSLPWQCARHFGSDKAHVPAEVVEGVAVAGAQAPAALTGRAASILGMPAPSIAPIIENPAAETPDRDTAGSLPASDESVIATTPSAANEVNAAVAVFSPPPRYPARSLRSGEEGTVMIRVNIDSSGMPVDVQVESSSRSRALDRAAVDAVRDWRFKPAFAQGAAVESSLTIPIKFKSGSDH